MASLPASTLAPFQRVLHAPASTVLDLKPCDHVTPAVQELHWLPVAERIQYKLCWLVHESLLGHMPEYILDLLTSVANILGRSTIHASCVATSSCCGHVDELAIEPFLLLHCEHGTGCRWSLSCCDRQTCFGVIWKHLCFLFESVYVMHPQSSSRGRNTSASVTVTVGPS